MGFDWSYFTKPEFLFGVVVFGLLLSVLGNLLSRRLEKYLASRNAKRREELQERDSDHQLMVQQFRTDAQSRLSAQVHATLLLGVSGGQAIVALIAGTTSIGLTLWLASGSIVSTPKWLVLGLAVLAFMVSLVWIGLSLRTRSRGLRMLLAVVTAEQSALGKYLR